MLTERTHSGDLGDQVGTVSRSEQDAALARLSLAIRRFRLASEATAELRLRQLIEASEAYDAAIGAGAPGGPRSVMAALEVPAAPAERPNPWLHILRGARGEHGARRLSAPWVQWEPAKGGAR